MKRFMFAVMAIATIAFAGCEKGEDAKSNVIQLTSSDQTMYYDDEFQINATSDTPITYTSENEYHAEVSASGLVTAGRVGETNIVLTNGEDTKKVKITVRPQSNLYPEPDLTFGMSRSAVKAKLGTPDLDEGTGIAYNNYASATPILMCLFDEADNLKSYVVLVKTAYSGELGTFLAERYVPFDIYGENYAIACVNGLDRETITMAVAADLYNLSYWMVMYMPLSLTDTRAAVNRSDIMKSIEALMGK